MRKFTIAAAAALLSAGVALSGPAMAQSTTLDCPAGGNNHQGPVQGSTGAGQNAGPATPTCETLVQPNGEMTLQNGPAVNSPGSNTAPHEGPGSSPGNAGGSGSKG